MRILHLANHCRRSGNGIVNVAVDLACAQAGDGHAVAFASAPGEYRPLLEQSGVHFFPIGQRRPSPIGLAGAAAALTGALRGFRPEVVHAHMMTGAVLARALRPFFGFALVTTVHNEFQRTSDFMGVGDLVIAVSDAVAEALARRGFSRRRLRVVRNGPLGTPRLPPFDSIAPASLERPALVTVAGLYHRKGVAELIDAFAALGARFPRLHLYIVGDGPQRREFESRAERSPAAERIAFVGFVADPRTAMASADIFVLPSRQEPFGLVLTEAREAGCAIVATNVGGIPEALDGGAAGVLVPAGDPAALEGAIARLLDAPQDREALQRRARLNLDQFTVERVNRQTLAVYGEARAQRATKAS